MKLPKEHGRFHALLLGVLASIPLIRLLLHVHPSKTVDFTKPPVAPPSIRQIPIIYVHGFRGGDHTTKVMIDEICKAKHGSPYLRVTLDLFGNITYQGQWTSDAHPIVQLIMKDRYVGVLAIDYYLRYILPILAKKYHFMEYFAVGHSLGGPSLVRNEMVTAKRKNFPRMTRVAIVAGPFDGVTYLGDIPNINHLNERGRPLLMSPSYLGMLLNRKRFNPDISVLNIYGNIEDETNTDRYISVISAKSVRYILAPVVRRFHEVEVRGPAAEHSEMHDNPLVISIINDFMLN